ncbi:hypothetical protein ANN_17598 [Periplaneta americana]|uniref:DUF4817 domain-containing protein n=1 Tax=Periplaneta americana TaxID=6978 RepID=A0ABQ8STE4_PERAM|nr:hypothetical protein ANN_17598 [Periplaneta americana]
MNSRPERYHYAIDNTQNTSIITVDIRQRGPTTCNIACLRIVPGERPLFLLTAVHHTCSYNNNPWRYSPRRAKTDQQAAGLTATCRSSDGRSSNQNGDHVDDFLPRIVDDCNNIHTKPGILNRYGSQCFDDASIVYKKGGVRRYSFREQADIIFMYGRANGNGREAVQLYQMAFPDRRQPNHQTFVAVYRRVAETGTVAPQTGDRGRPRIVRTPNLEEDILHCAEDDPGISTRQLAVATGTSHSTAWSSSCIRIICNVCRAFRMPIIHHGRTFADGF